LFYQAIEANAMMVASVTLTPDFAAARRTSCSMRFRALPLVRRTVLRRDPDDRRFIMARLASDDLKPEAGQLVVVENLPEEVRRKLSEAGQ